MLARSPVAFPARDCGAGACLPNFALLYDAFLYERPSPGAYRHRLGEGAAPSLILALVDDRDLHGYDIARQIEERSGGTLHFTLASLYATLYRLEERKLIRGRWVEKAGQRRRRYYRITTEGRAVLATQREEWGQFIAALVQVAGLKPA